MCTESDRRPTHYFESWHNSGSGDGRKRGDRSAAAVMTEAVAQVGNAMRTVIASSRTRDEFRSHTGANSEVQNDQHAASGKGGSPLVQRALAALGRDDPLRRDYLRKRWQGKIESLRSSDQTQPFELRGWWARRLRTPLGRALSRLEETKSSGAREPSLSRR